jgi:hypothetical protein
MRTLRLSLVGAVILVLLGGLGVVVAGTGASEDVVVEVLSDRGVMPGEAIPEDAVRIALTRTSIEPGLSGEKGSDQPHAWASLEYVQHGSLTFTDDDRMRIWRAGGATEDVPAGTTVSVETGDLVLFYEGGAGRSFTNLGPEPFVTITVAVGDDRTPAEPQGPPPGVDWRLLDLNVLPPESVDLLFTTPVAVTFERVTLAPGAELMFGVDDIPMLTFVYVEAGRVHRTVRAADIEGGRPVLAALPMAGDRASVWRLRRAIG